MYTSGPPDVDLAPVNDFPVHANDNYHISVAACCAQLHYWSYRLPMYTVLTIHMYTFYRLSHGTYVYGLYLIPKQTTFTLAHRTYIQGFVFTSAYTNVLYLPTHVVYNIIQPVQKLIWHKTT